MALCSLLGVVYLIYHVFVQKSIIWSDFNLQKEGGEILQAGLGLFLLQVGGSKSKQEKGKRQAVETCQSCVTFSNNV